MSIWCFPPCLSETTLPQASLQILSPSLPGSPDCDAWLSVFSKSPLVAGSRPPPLPQTAIKKQSMAALRAAWKWEDTGGRDGGRRGTERKRMRKTPWYWLEAQKQGGNGHNEGMGVVWGGGLNRREWGSMKNKKNKQNGKKTGQETEEERRLQ